MTLPQNLHCYDLQPEQEVFRDAVLQGLSRTPKRLSPKFFYDAEGSRLFDAITELDEYYPTRTEIGLLRTNGGDIASWLGGEQSLVELGSGSDVKIRVLLDAVQPAAYVPVDISRSHLYRSAAAIAWDHPQLEVHAVCADYSEGLRLPEAVLGHQRAAFFPGSSIGNFEPEDATSLLRQVAQALGPGGKLLIGVDLKKESTVLDAAYNDAAGVTAAFNRNLLVRMRRELDAVLDPTGFAHRAFYNEALGRIEMHLMAQGVQQIRIDGEQFSFTPGETLHTENSYKYEVEEFLQLAGEAGFCGQRLWCDDDNLFSVHGLEVAA